MTYLPAALAWAGAAATWFGVVVFHYLWRRFMAGPPSAAADMADALAERRSGERHWTAGGR